MEFNGKAKLEELLNLAISYKASDLHLLNTKPPILRVDGHLKDLANQPLLTPAMIEKMVLPILSPQRLAVLKETRDLDFSFSFSAVRVRANVYYERSSLSASFRLIPKKIPSLEELGVPPIVKSFVNYGQGLVLITGPTGHGKSTTLAALIDLILSERNVNVITLEDPIEYVFSHKKGAVSQREVGADVISFARGLRAALREDPDVAMIGEMRDLETIEACLTVAETGHLVFSTLHTNSASQTADRIIDVFPPYEQNQIRQQFASVLLGVVSQRLIPRVNGGRMLACEIMIADNAVRNVIREGKTHQLANIISTSASEGMITLDKVLAQLVRRGEITLDDALVYCSNPKQFKLSVY